MNDEAPVRKGYVPVPERPPPDISFAFRDERLSIVNMMGEGKPKVFTQVPAEHLCMRSFGSHMSTRLQLSIRGFGLIPAKQQGLCGCHERIATPRVVVVAGRRWKEEHPKYTLLRHFCVRTKLDGRIYCLQMTQGGVEMYLESSDAPHAVVGMAFILGLG